MKKGTAVCTSDRMQEDTYGVEVLHYVSPHLIWVKTSSAQNKYTLEQIGLYGVVPVQCATSQEKAEWPAKTVEKLDRFFAKAANVRFVPTFIDRRSSVFDNNVHKFGDIIIETTHGKVKRLSEALVKSRLGCDNIGTFHNYLSNGKIKTKLSHEATNKIIKILKIAQTTIPRNQWEDTIRALTTTHNAKAYLLKEDNLKQTLSPGIKARDIQEIITRKSKDLEYCKGSEYEYLGRGYSRSSKSDSSDSSRMLALRKKLHKTVLKTEKEVFEETIKSDTIDRSEKLKKIKQYLIEQEELKANSIKDEELRLAKDKKKVASEEKSKQCLTAQVVKAMYTKSKKLAERTNSISDENGIDKTLEKTKSFEETNIFINNEQDQIKKDELRNATSEDEELNSGDDYQKAFIESYMQLELERVKLANESWQQAHGDGKKKPDHDKMEKWVNSPNTSGLIGPKAKKVSNSDGQIETYFTITPGDIPHARLKLQKLSKNVPTADSNPNTETVIEEKLDSWKKTLRHEEDLFEDSNVIQHTDDPTRLGEDSFVDDIVKPRNNVQSSSEAVFQMDVEDQLKLIKFVAVDDTNNVTNVNGNVKLKKIKSKEVTVETIAVNDKGKGETDVSSVNSRLFQKRLALLKRAVQNSSNCSEVSNDENRNKIVYKKVVTESLIDDSDLTDFDEDKFLTKSEKVDTSDIQIKKYHEYQVNPFKYTDSLTSKFIENMLTPQLMVHSKHQKRIKPTFDIKNVHFSNRIHRVLTEMGIKQPMTLQTVSWDTILRGHSFFMVSPRRSGKSMGYLPAVCFFVADQKDIKDNSGPICVIICDTANAVAEVAKKCMAFLSREKVLAGYAGVDLTRFVAHLLNGCDILVTTPCYLVKLLTLEKYPVDLRSLSIVVLDGCERIDKTYLNEFKLFYSRVKKMLKTRTVKCIQYIITSTEWCGLMDTMSKILTNAVISIGYYQECVIYSNANTSVNFVMDGSKVDVVLEFLNGIDVKKRTVIVCTTNAEVKELEDALKKKNYVVFTGHTDISVELLYNLKTSWFEYCHPAIGPILVSCDLTLSHLNITNANYLVHYSLPKTFSSFCKRFACLIDNYKSVFEDIKKDVKIKILIDSENTDELPKVLNFMKRCTKNIPEALNEISEKVLIDKDQKKALSYYPVCDGLLAFGECPDFWFCDKRHSFSPARDTPVDWIPKSGTIKFSILHFHTAAHYSVRIMSYSTNGKEIKLPQTYGTLASKMGMHYLNEKNIKLHGIPQLGDVCAVSLRPNDFERCQVVRILRRCEKGNPAILKVNLIDAECEEIVKDVDLFHLPDEFKNVSSYVAQIRLANIQPNDLDINFSDLSKDYLKRMLKEAGHLYLRATVLLSVGNTILVEQIEACQDLKTFGGTVVRYNFKDLLCDAHACPNDEHLPKLLKLCETCGIKLPEDKEETIEIEQKEKVILPSPQWAHLEGDSLVYFSSAENPDKFFVRLVQFEDCLSHLTKDIQEHVKNAKENGIDSLFDKGEYVLAKFPDDSLYYRARIDYMSDDNSSQKPNCFFVDHGEWRSVPTTDLEPITEKFITVLPFQAIECRLIGLEPVGNQWSEWTINYFSDLCFETASDDILKQLHVKYFMKEKAESTDGHKYCIVMVDATGEDEVLINDIMLNANMAGLKESEREYLENFKFVKPKKKEDSDIEEIERDDEAAWEKTAAAYKDEHYEATYSEEVLLNSEEFDVEFTNEDLKELVKLGKKMDSTASVKSDSSKISSDFSVIDEVSKSSQANDCLTEILKSNCSSYDIIDPKPELDSDDLSSPERSICCTPKLKIDLVETSIKNINKPGHKGIAKSKNTDDCLHNTDIKENIDKKYRSCDKNDHSSDKNDYSSDKNDNSSDKSNHSTDKNNHSCDKNDQRRPKLTWHQSKTIITIKIEVTAIEKYQIDVKPKTLTFSTYAHDTNYGFSLELYGCVKPDKCTHAPKGLYVLIKLEKLLKLNWKQLTKDSKVRRWIVYDHDALVCAMSDDDDDKDYVMAEKEKLKDYVWDMMDRSETESDSDEDFVGDVNK